MQDVDTVIKNGKIATPYGIFEAGVAIDNGRIQMIAKNAHLPRATQILDARGNILLPGVIDGHVHCEDPGFPRREDFETATRAAACGGVTTVIDHPLTIPVPATVELLVQKRTLLEPKALVDFGLHGALLPTNIGELERTWNWGVPAVKAFFCSSEPDYPAMYEGELFVALEKLAKLNGLCLIHAENDPMLKFNLERLQQAGRKDWQAHADSRPPLVELLAIRTFVSLLEHTGASGLLAHTSIPEGVKKAIRARLRGVRVFVESYPHYFHMTNKDLTEKGPWVKIAPPLRNKELVTKLWEQLAKGWIDVLASDHSPYEVHEKEQPFEEGDIWAAPCGMPGTETMLPLMLMSVNRGNLSLERLVEVLSSNPAKLYGLYPQKGTIQPGADADLVLIDMKREWTIKSEKLHSKAGWTPYEEWRVRGVPYLTMVRGEVLMEEGEVIGRPGYGKFLPRRVPPPIPQGLSL